MMNEKISWKFPIVGITESASSTIDYTFKTRCRQKIEREVRFSLPGVTEIDPNEQFMQEINVFSKEFENSLKKWFVLSPMVNTISDSSDQLVYLAKLLPYKPFKAVIEVVIVKPNGGRWRYKFLFVKKIDSRFSWKVQSLISMI